MVIFIILVNYILNTINLGLDNADINILDIVYNHHIKLTHSIILICTCSFESYYLDIKLESLFPEAILFCRLYS